MDAKSLLSDSDHSSVPCDLRFLPYPLHTNTALARLRFCGRPVEKFPFSRRVIEVEPAQLHNLFDEIPQYPGEAPTRFTGWSP